MGGMCVVVRQSIGVDGGRGARSNRLCGAVCLFRMNVGDEVVASCALGFVHRRYGEMKSIMIFVVVSPSETLLLVAYVCKSLTDE